MRLHINREQQNEKDDKTLEFVFKKNIAKSVIDKTT